MKRVILLGWCVALGSAAMAAEPAAAAYRERVVPLLKKHCYQCHGAEEAEGGLAFTDYKDFSDVTGDVPTWKSVQDYVRAHQMPPAEGKAKLATADRRWLVEWIDDVLHPVDPARPDPGRVTIRRLNRAEYGNSVRDLIGVTFDPAADFPADDSGYGFDNIGDVLSLPPMLMEKYLAAAEQIMSHAIITEPPAPTTRRFASSQLQVGFNAVGDRGDGWIHLVSLEDDDAGVELDITAPGDYVVRVHAFAQPTGGIKNNIPAQKMGEPDETDPPTQITLALNEANIATFAVTVDEGTPGTYEARMGLVAGKQRIRAMNQRLRGGRNDFVVANGRLGKQQKGVLFVKWLEIEGPVPGLVRRFAAENLHVTGPAKAFEHRALKLTGNGEVTLPVTLPSEAECIVRVQAFADQAGTEPARMEIKVGGQAVRSFNVWAPGYMHVPPGKRTRFEKTWLMPRPQVYEARVRLPAGRHEIAAAFVNDFEDPAAAHPSRRDRNLIVQHIEVVNLERAWEPPPLPAPLEALFARHRLPGVDDETAARGIVREFGLRAWRRPLGADEQERLMALYQLATRERVTFPECLRLVLQAMLVSPHFLFRGETRPASDGAATAYPVDEFALATRLSYFLWSTTPDDELLRLAGEGRLRKELPAQVRRMLASPRAEALTKNFAGQWLQTRALGAVYPDQEMFADFNEWLRSDMQTETERFFGRVVQEDRSLLEFLTADYTFANERLAKFYGIEGVSGDDFRLVSLVGTRRRGVLTHGSVLALTSNPTRTSPVKRGKWVLENLLGITPPPPPPDIPELPESKGKTVGTLREQMQRHRAEPACASCHEQMDAIGFGLENFNTVGAWREKDGDNAIDAGGELGPGETFAGAVELSEVLATTRRKEFLQCVAEKTLTYALGRGLDPYDRLTVKGIVERLEANECKFSELVLGVVESVSFQMRRGDKPLAVR